MKNSYVEFFVGVFLALGIVSLAYLSIKVARKEFTAGGYEVQALFSNASGLRTGSSVMIAGVEIGRVSGISLNEYEAKVQMVIHPDVALQQDVIASIRTKGLIGERYVELSPGGADEKIPPGGFIRDTEPAMDVEGLISRFVQGNLAKPANPAGAK